LLKIDEENDEENREVSREQKTTNLRLKMSLDLGRAQLKDKAKWG
jgi:hypothetical protein